MQNPDEITDVLNQSKVIAVVGLSANPMRPSHGVAAYMQSQGYRIVPVNPNIGSALGEKAYPTVLDVPGKIDIVDVFRQPAFVPGIVDQVIQLHVPVLWLQEEVVHQEAAKRAREAGIKVFMDLCILKEHRRRFR